MIMYRVIRGMVPHKTARGEAALARLKVFEGIPDEYQKMKRMVVPDALRATRLRPNRRYCVVGDVATRVGWKHADLIVKMEGARRAKSAEYYTEKKAKVAAHAAAKASISA
jgi:large subunit ribosomal protein L13Ae